MNDDLHALYAFNRWANDRMVEAIRKLAPEQYIQEPVPGWSSVRQSLVHIASATDLWARSQVEEVIKKLTEETEYPTLDDALRLLEEGQSGFERLLAARTPEQIAAIWTTTDWWGKELKVPHWVVYRHVVNHATYHRGQIASKLKRLGVEPPYTDFFFWVTKPPMTGS